MKRAEFLNEVLTQYDVVNLLSKKNGSEILRLRHKTQNKDLVLRSYPKPIEAYQSLKSITHQNIPVVYDVVNLEDGQIVLEEFISGLTVAEILEEGKYTYHGAKQVIYSVANALLALRSLNIVHRDIKPENIVISQNGCVKLIDFNASRVHTKQKKKDTVALGTIGYAPPEQFGISQSDEKSDIYSIGVLLNVMLTGVHPSKKLARGKAGRIVLKCTQIDPQSRFSSIENLIVKL